MIYEHLVGKQFQFGVQDCFSLIREFCIDNDIVSMPNYARPTNWQADSLDIIEKVYPKHGFHKVEATTITEMWPGDLLCMAVGSCHANHLAAYVGDNTIVHQVINQLSRAEPMRDFWKHSTCYILRHETVRPILVDKPNITLMELVNARYQVQTDNPI